jgi:hypothetical protein
VTRTPQAWRDDVEKAALAADQDALVRLHDEAADIFGPAAEHTWVEALSALDGTAQTG